MHRLLNNVYYLTDLKVAELATTLDMDGYAKRVTEKMYDFYQKQLEHISILYTRVTKNL